MTLPLLLWFDNNTNWNTYRIYGRKLITFYSIQLQFILQHHHNESPPRQQQEWILEVNKSGVVREGKATPLDSEELIPGEMKSS